MIASVLWVLAYLVVGLITSIVLTAIFPPNEFEGSDGLVISVMMTWPIVVATGIGCFLGEYVICPASDWIDKHRPGSVNWCLFLSQRLRHLFVQD